VNHLEIIRRTSSVCNFHPPSPKFPTKEALEPLLKLGTIAADSGTASWKNRYKSSCPNAYLIKHYAMKENGEIIV
jgi:hypothetical protein